MRRRWFGLLVTVAVVLVMGVGLHLFENRGLPGQGWQAGNAPEEAA